MNITLQRCQLCDDYCVLQKSHIIGRFIEKWLKKVSLLPTFISSRNFNADIQDAYVDYFLCKRCEQLLGQRESHFARFIFHPWINNKTVHSGKEAWLTFFLISIIWRCGRWLEIKQAKELGLCYFNTLPGLDNLRCYLLGRSTLSSSAEPQLFYTKVETCTAVEEGATNGATPLFDYMTRFLDPGMFLANDKTGLSVFVKFPHFLVWQTVSGDQWKADDLFVKEFCEGRADFCAEELRANTRISTRSRRDLLIKKKFSNADLTAFYSSDIGDNIRRAQLYLETEK